MSEAVHVIRVGDKLRDNDPRMPENRTLTVVSILPNGVEAMDSIGRKFRYLMRRIHTDGKARKSGLSLIGRGERNE